MIFFTTIEGEKHGAIGAFGINQEIDGIALGIGAFVGDEFEIRVLKIPICILIRIAIATNREENSPFNLATFGICHHGGESVLPGFSGLELELAIAFAFSVGFPLLDFFFDNFAVLAGDLIENKFSLGCNFFAVGTASGNGCLDGIANASVATVEPYANLIGLAGGDDAATAYDGSA